MAIDADAAANQLMRPDDPPPSTSDRMDTEITAGTDTAPAVDGQPPTAGLRPAAIIGVVTIVALSVVAGWHGYRAWQSHDEHQSHNVLLQVGRQAAVNLTTIDYNEIDADVARIVDSSTGKFHDDFQKRAPAFIEVVKKAKSKSQGTISGAALESAQGGQAQVLVAVNVRTATPSDVNPQPHGWRMRISVQQTGDGAKVSNVEFVP